MTISREMRGYPSLILPLGDIFLEKTARYVRTLIYMSSILTLVYLSVFLSIVSIVIAYDKRNQPVRPNSRMYGTILLTPLLLGLLFYFFSIGCSGDAGAGFTCYGSNELGQAYFGFGFIFGLLIYPLTVVTTPIGTYFLARSFMHQSNASLPLAGTNPMPQRGIGDVIGAILYFLLLGWVYFFFWGLSTKGAGGCNDNDCHALMATLNIGSLWLLGSFLVTAYTTTARMTSLPPHLVKIMKPYIAIPLYYFGIIVARLIDLYLL